MIDLESVFGEGKDLAAAITSDSVDFHQDKPNSGLWDGRLFVLVCFPTVGSGTGTVTFNVQDSADNSSFATVLSCGPIAGTSLAHPIAIPLPVEHKRYVRVTTTVSGTVAGKASLFLADGATLPVDTAVQGSGVVATID